MKRSVIPVVLSIMLGLCAATAVSAKDQRTAEDDFQSWIAPSSPSFKSRDELVAAFKDALAKNDDEGLARLLGLDPAKVLKNEDVKAHLADIRSAAARSVTMKEAGPDGVTLVLGDDMWPFPFPAVSAKGAWSFDTVAGLEEVISRRIGENELRTISNMRAYVDAQDEYHESDWDDDGVPEYARRLISSPGAYDGLYWEPGDGVPESPAGEQVDKAQLSRAEKDGYFGYHYRVLVRQGDNVAGGKYDYVINDNMIAGFGLVAFPAHYGRSGVKTFIVNQAGVVYEKDLGRDTETIAGKMLTFNPDKGWSVVTDDGD